jgi:RNA polymerase-binding transcription factor DksA
MEYYVYVHKRLTDGSIFYVGKGKNNRLNIAKNRNKHWEHIVKKDGGYIAEIIYDGLTNEDALKKEIELISTIGKQNLCNISDGGDGFDNSTLPPEKYEKWIENKKKAQTGKISYWKDKTRNEHSKKIKEIAIKTNCYKNNGKSIRTDEWKYNQSVAALNRIRKKVICKRCGKEIPDTHMKRHQNGKNCKK